MNYQLLCTWNVSSDHQRRLETEHELQQHGLPASASAAVTVASVAGHNPNTENKCRGGVFPVHFLPFFSPPFLPFPLSFPRPTVSP